MLLSPSYRRKMLTDVLEEKKKKRKKLQFVRHGTK